MAHAAAPAAAAAAATGGAEEDASLALLRCCSLPVVPATARLLLPAPRLSTRCLQSDTLAQE